MVEAVVEALGLEDAQLAARLHFWIDAVVELPLVALVLVTGTLLTARVWPPTGLHVLKLAMGAIAVAANLYCIAFVILRYRHRHDPVKLRRYRAHVLASTVGLPFGAAAAYIGLSYFT